MDKLRKTQLELINLNILLHNYKSDIEVPIRTLEEQEVIIAELIRMETDLEKAIVADPEFREGLFWGKPRYGHPEGEVIYHIREVLDNVDRIKNISPATREKLRLITILHDTFKYKEHESRKIKGRTPDNHHAVFAANFAKKYLDDDNLIQLIKLHDEAYYAWQLHKAHRHLECQTRLDKLFDALDDNLQLFYLFFKCDTKTGDKNQEPLHWFESNVKDISLKVF